MRQPSFADDPTFNPDRLWFTSQGVYIMGTTDLAPWLWAGSVQDLINVLIAHPELSIESAQIIVRPEGVH